MINGAARVESLKVQTIREVKAISHKEHHSCFRTAKKIQTGRILSRSVKWQYCTYYNNSNPPLMDII